MHRITAFLVVEDVIELNHVRSMLSDRQRMLVRFAFDFLFTILWLSALCVLADLFRLVYTYGLCDDMRSSWAEGMGLNGKNTAEQFSCKVTLSSSFVAGLAFLSFVWTLFLSGSSYGPAIQ